MSRRLVGVAAGLVAAGSLAGGAAVASGATSHAARTHSMPHLRAAPRSSQSNPCPNMGGDSSQGTMAPQSAPASSSV